MANEIQELFDVAQHGQAKHKKYLNTLHKIYKKSELGEFLTEYLKHVLHAFHADPASNYATSILTFASAFCIEIVTEYEQRMNEQPEIEEYEPHPFFLQLVTEVLKYVPVNNLNLRYHSCQFLAMILGKFGADIAISDVICDKIQQTLLDRTADPKPQIRNQAIKALLRLQDPYDSNCPVIDCFINLLGDSVSSVRKLVVESIAPCQLTFGHIVNRLRDIDPSVRAVTFVKLSKVPAKALTIVNRQAIIMSGILEVNANVKRNFQEILLSKWLIAYESNVLKFMNALKLDANEEDVKETEMIYERILPIIFQMLSLQELVSLLGLNDLKLIPMENLNVENITYWNNFIGYIKNFEIQETDCEGIIPLLSDFVAYVDSFVNFKSQNNMEYWEYLEYHQVLRKLFELFLKLDVSDEHEPEMSSTWVDFYII